MAYISKLESKKNLQRYIRFRFFFGTYEFVSKSSIYLTITTAFFSFLTLPDLKR